MPHINWNTYSIGNDEKKKSNQFPIPQICRLFPCFSFFLTSCHCQLNVDGGWYVTRLSSLTLRSRRALSFPPAGQQLVSNFRPPHFPIFCFFFLPPDSHLDSSLFRVFWLWYAFIARFAIGANGGKTGDDVWKAGFFFYFFFFSWLCFWQIGGENSMGFQRFCMHR